MTVTAATNPFLDSILNPTNVHVVTDNDAATAAITDSNAAAVTASCLAKSLPHHDAEDLATAAENIITAAVSASTADDIANVSAPVLGK